MQVTTIETPGLGDRSYLISSNGLAVVIDPQRDVDRILERMDADGLTLALVCETHLHNDYVSGGLALSRLTGADYALNDEDDVTFDSRGLTDGEIIDLGAMHLTVLRSPGHTPGHLSFLIECEGAPAAVFTGGSMLYGTVGRTDLISADMTEPLSRAQHQSVRRMASMLPTGTEVFPTHGFGSFCASAGGGDRTAGTIAEEREENLACRIDDEDEFVATLVNGFTAHPPYYVHMGLLNRAGPMAPDLSTPSPTDPTSLAARIARGEWVVDVRPRHDFAARHLAGTLNVDGTESPATYLGWAIPWGTPVSLVGDDAQQVADVQRELARIGIDRPMAIALGGPDVYADGQPTGSYRAATFADLARATGATVVDVRRDDEWDDGHIEGAIHITMERLADEAAGLPEDTELWVHCASGIRASLGASLIARAGKRVVWLDDDWEKAEEAGLQSAR